MRKLTYVDQDGRKTLVELPDSAPDTHAKFGILVGPPSLKGLGLPAEVEIRLHNALFDRGLFTFKEVRGRLQDVLAALQSAYRVDVAAVTNLYSEGT